MRLREKDTVLRIPLWNPIKTGRKKRNRPQLALSIDTKSFDSPDSDKENLTFDFPTTPKSEGPESPKPKIKTMRAAGARKCTQKGIFTKKLKKKRS